MKKIYLSNTPKKFYYDLQQSRFRKNAFEEWKEYRDAVTNLLINSCDKSKSIALFGAGCCNDIDLSRLAGHFSKISLIDINEESLMSAIKQYGLINDSRIEIIVKDFVGMTDEDYINYAATIFKEYKNQGITFLLNERNSDTLKFLDYMYEKVRVHKLDFGNKCYDYSLALSLHSQLNDTASWIWTQIMSRYGEEINFSQDLISKRINFETGSIIKKFNDALFATTNEKAFIGYELGIEGTLSGVEGAIQTYHDLTRREHGNSIKSTDRCSLSWPYDRKQEIVFSMLVETFMVKDNTSE